MDAGKIKERFGDVMAEIHAQRERLEEAQLSDTQNTEQLSGLATDMTARDFEIWPHNSNDGEGL